MSFFSEFTQNVQVSSGNSSVANLGGGATFTGTKQSTLGVAAIRVNLKTDQNCTVYVDQAMDEVPNWDITDTYDYYSSKGGFSVTNQATASNVRVRVVNLNASVATTYFRLQTTLCPIVEAVPRSLSAEGNLKVGVYEIEGEFDTRVQVTPMSALKVIEPTRLVGSTFVDTLDANFWAQTTASGSATSSVASGTLTLSTGTTTASSNIVNSVRTARYIPGQTNYFRGQIRLPAVTGTNTRRVGAFDANNGYFLKHNGTTLSCCSRKAGVDTEVASGSFNGVLGATYTIDTNVHTIEIFWTNRSAWFIIDDYLLHKISSSTATSVATTHLQVGLECTNGANTNNNTLEVRSASILRLGKLETNKQYAHVSNLSTNVLKYGPGVLHGVVIGSVPTAAGTITIYDNTAASGTIISVLRAAAPNNSQSPVSIMFDSPFNTGLTVVSATTALDFTVIYE